MHFQSSDLFLHLSNSFCASLEALLAPIADCFLPFIDALGVANFIVLMIVTVFCIVASALKLHEPSTTVRLNREPKRWIKYPRIPECWGREHFNWEHATPLLLSRNPIAARRARQAFLGKNWKEWKRLPAANRKAMYRYAIAQ